MNTASVGRDTVEIVARGTYVAPSGAVVSIADQVERAKAGTVRYTPEQVARLSDVIGLFATRVDVTHETTARATQRLAERGTVAGRVACLNFASAKNPGGGFLGGAKAQEEDLARRSALYACQLTQKQHYDLNRACGSTLYTDSLIWSPAVPFFRDDRLELVEEPWLAGVVTSPAPNAGAEAKKLGADVAQPAVRATLARRAGHVLAALAHHKQDVIVLGAWGCGVFRNDPVFVADVFAELLATRFRGAFAHVVFAVYDSSADRATLRAFEERFAAVRA